jgi:hypothetical protein
MEHKLLKTKFLLFCFLLNTVLNAQNIVNNIVAQANTVSGKQHIVPKKFVLKHLVREGLSYLQIVEDDVVLLQIVEDDVVLWERIINDRIKIRLSTKNNQTTAQFLKGTEVLKIIIEDDVVLLESIVEDDVVLLKSIIEDDVVLLESIVEYDVVLLKSKDSINLYNINASKQINTDSTKQIAHDSTKQIIHDSLRAVVIRSLGKISVGISAGTNALFGIDVAYKVLPRVALRLGFNYFKFDIRGIDIGEFNILSIPKNKTATDIAGQQSNIQLLADVSLTKKGGIRFTIGGAYMMKTEWSAKLRYKEEIAISSIVVTAQDMGYFKTIYTTKSPIAPYIGIGLGRLVPKRRMNVSFDFGTYYQGSPVIKIDATGLLKRNVENEAALNRNLAAFKWYPVANMRVAYRLY